MSLSRVAWGHEDRAVLGACQNGSVNALQELMVRGFDIHRETVYGTTSLSTATQFEEFEVVQFLLEQQANVNWINSNGVTVIHYVSSEKMLDLLINGGLDIHLEEDSHRSPLCYLARNEQVDMVKCLIKAGVKYQHLDFDIVSNDRVRQEIINFISYFEANEEKKQLENNIKPRQNKSALKI